MIKLPKKYLHTPMALSIAAALVTAPSLMAADFRLEEIVVTATKTDEMMTDVPISLSVVTSEDVKKFNIQRFEDATAYIPNFSVSKDPIGDKINIRGIQSGNQAGFEQSVGTFVDGVYRGRGVQARYAFLDIGVVEVLRGPQGTLFGKNTIGGALNIKSTKPSHEFEAEIGLQENIDFEETEIKGHISGPITEELRARFAFMDRVQDEGWVENLGYDEGQENDEQAFRLTLEWDMGEDTLVTFKHEQGEFDNTGSNLVMHEPGSLGGFGFPGIGNGLKDLEHNAANSAAAFESIFGPGSAGDVTPIDYGTSQGIDGENSETAITLEHYTGNSTITAIVAYSDYDFERILDADVNPFPIVQFNDTEDFEQTSLELRWASDFGNGIEFITGLYYQDNEMTVDAVTMFNTDAIYALTNATCLMNGGDNSSGLAAATTPSAALANACLTSFGLAGASTVIDGAGRYAVLDQESETIAVFGQMTYEISDTLRAIVGLRYSEEEKTATQTVDAIDYIKDNKTPIVVTDAYTGTVEAVAQIVGEFTKHAIPLERDEESTTWSATLQWDASDEVMTYLTASTGFKAGGFNSFYMGQTSGGGFDANDAEFEEEEVMSVELGAKMSLLDGRAELNVAVYHIAYDDLQVSVFSGNTTFEVQNAAEAISQGLEIDGRFQATENLMITAAMGWIDFEFDSFPNQACTNEQFLTYRQANWVSGNPASMTNNADCAAAGVNNLKGETTEGSPEFSASLVATHVLAIDDFELSTSVAMNYMDEVSRQGDNDPIDADESQTKFDLSLQFGPADGNWDVSVIAKNITDEQSISYANDTPLFPGSHQSAADQPRNVAIAGRVRF